MQKRKNANLRQMFNSTLSTFSISCMAFTITMVIDGIVIGQFLGTEAIAAYGLAMPIMLAKNAIFSVLATGEQSICGNCMGRGDMKSANGCFNATLIVVMAIGIVLTAVLAIFAEPLGILLGANGEDANISTILDGTKMYILGLAVGVPFEAYGHAVSPLMQLDNDRDRVTTTAIVCSAVNIIGDLANVFVLN